MKTLILILLIYAVMQLIKKAAQGQQQTRQDLPEFRIVEDDAPLSGPWNRRTETSAESPLPGPRDIPGIPGKTRGDVPLPGPWERKPPREQPGELKTEPRWETEYKPKPAYEPGPVREKRHKPQPENRPRDRAVEPVIPPESRRDTDTDARVTGRGVSSAVGDCETIGPQERRAAALQEPVRRKRKRRRRDNNPLTAVLSCNTTLVGSMVLGRVLGTRGGRAAEQRTQR